MSRLFKTKCQHLIRKDYSLFWSRQTVTLINQLSQLLFTKWHIDQIERYFFWDDTIEQYTSDSCLFHCSIDLSWNFSFKTEGSCRTNHQYKVFTKSVYKCFHSFRHQLNSNLRIVFIIDRTRNEDIDS